MRFDRVGGHTLRRRDPRPRVWWGFPLFVVINVLFFPALVKALAQLLKG